MGLWVQRIKRLLQPRRLTVAAGGWDSSWARVSVYKQEAEIVYLERWEVRIMGGLEPQAVTSNTPLPTGPHLLIHPRQPPTGDQLFKYMSLWGQFSVKSPVSSSISGNLSWGINHRNRLMYMTVNHNVVWRKIKNKWCTCLNYFSVTMMKHYDEGNLSF